MDIPDYDSPKALKAYLEGRGLAMSKRFGQNFLVSREARMRILGLIGAAPGMRVWEIGPGLGALTSGLLEAGAAVIAFEIDRGFIQALESTFGGQGRLVIRPGDFLKTWRGALEESGMPDIVCGNLPYNAANAFMADFATRAFYPARMVFTVQRECAERMRAKVGTAAYSSFSILCQSFYMIERSFDLPPACFWPTPGVTSSVVLIRPRQDSPAIHDRQAYLELLRTLFASRRKTIHNNLRGAGWSEDAIHRALAHAGVDPGLRAETLPPERIAAISDALQEESRAP